MRISQIWENDLIFQHVDRRKAQALNSARHSLSDELTTWLALPVNTGNPFILCLFRDYGIAGKAQPGFMYQFLNITQMGAGRAMIVVLGHAAGKFNQYLMGLYVVGLLGLFFKKNQFPVYCPAAAAAAGERQLPDIIRKIKVLKAPCSGYISPVAIISRTPFMNYMTLDDGYQFYHSNLLFR